MLSRSQFQLASASDSSSSPPKPPTPIDYLRQHPKKARITSYETSWQPVEPYRQVGPPGHYAGHLQHHQHPSQLYTTHHLQQPYLACSTAPGGVSIKTEASSYLPFSTPEYTNPTYSPRESYSRAAAAAAAVMHTHESKHYFQGPQTQLGHAISEADSNTTYTTLAPPGVTFSDTDHVSKSEPCLTPTSCYFSPDMTLTSSYNPVGAPRRDSDSMYGIAPPSDCYPMSIPQSDTSMEFTTSTSVYDTTSTEMTLRQLSSTTSVRSAHYPERELSMYKDKMETKPCAVCEDTAAGFHCGAFVCEACKKFFIRSWKAENNQRYQCTKNETCRITKDTRTHCQRCRYKKCIALKMVPPNMRPNESPDISAIPCRVCGAKSSGFHFGALTCEGCKGFFRRTIHERTSHPYNCSKSRTCVINTQTRNNCKACRFTKCLNVGMSKHGSRIGRQPNAIKHLCREEIRNQRRHRLQRQQQQAKIPLEPSISSFPSSPLMSSQDNFRLNPTQGLPQSLQSSQIMGDEAPLRPTAISEVTSSVCPNNVLNSPTDTEPSLFLPSDLWPLEEFRKSLVIATNPLLKDTKMEIKFEDRITDKMSTKEVLHRILTRFYSHALKVIKYAYRTPDFERISTEYHSVLVKGSMYSITLIQLSMEYDTITGCYNYFDFSDEERDIILSHFHSFKGVCEHLCFSGQLIKSCNLNEVEMSLLCYIEFISGEKDDLTCKTESVCRRLHQRALDALEDYIRTEHLDSGLRGDKLLEIQTHLNRMKAEHRQIVNVLSDFAKQNDVICSISNIDCFTLYNEVFRLSENPDIAAPYITPISHWIGEDDQREADSTTRDFSSTTCINQLCTMEDERQHEVSTTRHSNEPIFATEDWNELCRR